MPRPFQQFHFAPLSPPHSARRNNPPHKRHNTDKKMIDTKEEGRALNAAHQAVPPGTLGFELTSNPPAVNGGGANGNSNGHGKHASVVHLKRSGGHAVACGLDLHYFRDAIVSRTVAQVNCRRCLRAHGALTALRCKARRWDRFAGHRPKRTYIRRPLVSLAEAFDRAART